MSEARPDQSIPTPPGDGPTEMAPVTGLQGRVARAADTADLHAPVPTLLLELQTTLGNLCATVSWQTDRGRRPFRPGPDWPQRLGELAFGVYLLADQTGIDIAAAIQHTAAQLETQGQQAKQADEQGWPFEG